MLRAGAGPATPWWLWTGRATAPRRPTRMRWRRPEQRVALAYGAVDKILGASPRGAGLFLLGHSAGCELAVRMAADERAEQELIGLELAGTGVRYHPATAKTLIRPATATARPDGLREICFGSPQTCIRPTSCPADHSATGAAVRGRR